MLRRTPLAKGSKQLKRSGFARKTHVPLKNRTTGQISAKKRTSGLKRVGAVGKANLEANKIIRAYLEANPIQRCELKFALCLGGLFLQVAHKHPRAWYKGDVALLSDPKQYVIACTSCHEMLDGRSEMSKQLTEKVFRQLRP